MAKNTIKNNNDEPINESRLVYEVMQKLGKYGAVYRTNSGAFRLPNGKYFRALPEGFSDVMFIRPDGVTCFIECKYGRGKATDKQTAFLAKMQGLNCRAGVAYTVADAMIICGIQEADNVLCDSGNKIEKA